MQAKTLLIIGYGLEGRSAYEYYVGKKDSEFSRVIILDEAEKPKFELPEGVEFVSGKVEEYDFSGVDLIIRTPAVDPRRIKIAGQQVWDEVTRQSKEKIVIDGEEVKVPKIWSLVNEFFEVCPTRHIVGVTGTKGKGTTATLIHEMLLASGFNSHLGGNIGVPVMDLLESTETEDYVVLELSSFQLWDFVGSPETAILLKIEPEHLDVHTGFEDYAKAKGNLFTNMTSGNIVHFSKNEIVNSLVEDFREKRDVNAGGIEGVRMHGYMDDNDNLACKVLDGKFVIAGQIICETSEMKLIGEHSYENICAAITAVWSYTQDIDSISSIIKTYKGQSHRLQLVGKTDGGLEFYDDSIGVVPTATVAAMRAVKGSKIMLLGGKSRGLDLSQLATEALSMNVVGVVLTGETAGLIERLFVEVGFDAASIVNLGMSKMDQVVPAAIKLARVKGADAVILSSGCPSFDLYKDYIDKAEQFSAAISPYLDQDELEEEE
jgi:UDP-N-acetylmuramoylalanine--D-glutamate ligase